MTVLSVEGRTVLALAVLAVLCCPTAAQSSGADRSTESISAETAISALARVAKAGGQSIRLEYRGKCDSDAPSEIPLDIAVDGAAVAARDTLRSARAVLRNNENLTIAETSTRIVLVRNTSATSPVIDARIDSLKLTPVERYNPEVAVDAGVFTVKAQLERIRARSFMKFGGLLTLPPARAPHLKSNTKYRTIRDLLDDVGRTFPGVVVYRDCITPKGDLVFDFRFYQ